MPIVVEQVAVETIPNEATGQTEPQSGSQAAVPNPRALGRELRSQLERERQRSARVRAH